MTDKERLSSIIRKWQEEKDPVKKMLIEIQVIRPLTKQLERMTPA